MARSTFNSAQVKGTPKPAKTADTTEIAARYFVYKLFNESSQPQRLAFDKRVERRRGDRLHS
jgi:hypothetical protein